MAIIVSIAGAILWGVLRAVQLAHGTAADRFNRRGDSLGGAALNFTAHVLHMVSVSIAGAILWGVLRTAMMRVTEQIDAVSIAGAILWGVLRLGLQVS